MQTAAELQKTSICIHRILHGGIFFPLMLHFCMLIHPALTGEGTKGLSKAAFQNAPIVLLIASKYTWAQLYADIVLAVG